MAPKVNRELAGLRAKAELYDELVERLEAAEDEVEQLRRLSHGRGVDSRWREIADELGAALRPYTLFREVRIEKDRAVIEVRVPAPTLRAANTALDALARQVAVDSYRAHGVPVREDEARAA